MRWDRGCPMVGHLLKIDVSRHDPFATGCLHLPLGKRVRAPPQSGTDPVATSRSLEANLLVDAVAVRFSEDGIVNRLK
jgi:hypothetical protein